MLSSALLMLKRKSFCKLLQLSVTHQSFLMIHIFIYSIKSQYKMSIQLKR